MIPPHVFHQASDCSKAHLCVVNTDENIKGRHETNTIYLGPGHGFGSGRHPTTRKCLMLLEKFFELYSPKRIPNRVLDAGTGNGILAIAAALLGANHVIGVEREKEAVETARRNLLINHVQDRVDIKQGDILNLKGTYDLIIANLCPDRLSQLACALEKLIKQGGHFILSGLTGFEKDRTLRLLMVNRGLILIEDLWDQGWTTVMMRKPEKNKT